MYVYCGFAVAVRPASLVDTGLWYPTESAGFIKPTKKPLLSRWPGIELRGL
jgi:hypothetical protein